MISQGRGKGDVNFHNRKETLLQWNRLYEELVLKKYRHLSTKLEVIRPFRCPKWPPGNASHSHPREKKTMKKEKRVLTYKGIKSRQSFK